MKNSLDFSRVLGRMRMTCIVCMGVLTVLTLCGLWFSATLMPVIAFLLMIPIVIMGNGNLNRGDVNCSLINHYTFFALLLCGLCMFAINLINTRWITVPAIGEDHVNYISTLIVYPIGAFMYGVAIIRRGNTEYCQACKEKSCHSVQKSLTRNYFHRESKHLIKYMFGLCILMSIVAWGYYFTFYININLNTPDIFFFFVTPTAMYLLFVLYISSRYANLHFQFSINPTYTEKWHETKLRYWVIAGDKMMLQPIGSDNQGGLLFDTPAVGSIRFTENVDIEQAKEEFKDLSGISKFALKYLFQTSDEHDNCMHYAVILADGEEDKTKFEGQYFTLYEMNDMLKHGMLVKPLAYELHRVYNITMAWKTYDANGKRLYPIKNYRPSFRLHDLKDWNVDYDDLSWMSVAKNNEDKPFFRFKKFWRTHVSGIDVRWKNGQ